MLHEPFPLRLLIFGVYRATHISVCLHRSVCFRFVIRIFIFLLIFSTPYIKFFVPRGLFKTEEGKIRGSVLNISLLEQCMFDMFTWRRKKTGNAAPVQPSQPITGQIPLRRTVSLNLPSFRLIAPSRYVKLCLSRAAPGWR